MTRSWTLSEIKEKILKKIGFRAEFLSKEYINFNEKLLFKCKLCGSTFEQSAAKALASKKNPCCVKNKKKTKKEINIWAKNKNIILNDEEYINVNHLHSWKCLTCNEIITQSYVILRDIKNPCPKCFPRRERSFEDINRGVYERGYTLIQITEKRRLILKCFKCQNPFDIGLNNFFSRKQGCPICFGKKKFNIDYVKDIAEKKNCVCLSDAYQGYDNFYKFQCKKCNYLWEQTFNSFDRHFQECNKCRGYHSKGEIELKDFLKEITGEVWYSNRKIIGNNFEIDAYNPKYKVAFEYGGIFYHSINYKKDKNYHYNKMVKCEKKGITLITIFEDEWTHTLEKVKSRIRSLLNIYDKKKMARKLEVKEINRAQASIFYEANHLQGKNEQSIFSLGLFDKDELVAAMSLGSHPRQKKEESVIYLTRLCFKKGILILGGSKRLFQHCLTWAKNNNFNTIKSWSDNRWSDGGIYKNLNFKIESRLYPDYSYVDTANILRRSKTSMRKTKEERLTGKTEKELRDAQKMFRIYDCGKIRWSYEIN